MRKKYYSLTEKVRLIKRANRTLIVAHLSVQLQQMLPALESCPQGLLDQVDPILAHESVNPVGHFGPCGPQNPTALVGC